MDEKQKEWLQIVIAIISFILLWICYYVFQDIQAPFSFLVDMIPDLGAGLMVVILIYFVFTRQGIINQDKTSIIDEKTNTIIQKIDTIQSQLDNLSEGIGCLEKFHDTFYDYEWTDLIKSAEKEITLVVYYFDSWLKRNQDSLISFLKKPDTKLTVILSNPDNNIETIKRLFPDKTETSLKEKINHTKCRAENLINKAGVNSSRLGIYLYPYPLTYAIQSFDNTKVALSVFEMFREDRVLSPLFLLNLTKSEKTQKFIKKEIEGLIRDSIPFN